MSEEEVGKETAGGWQWQSGGRGPGGWVQSHKLLLKGWSGCQLPLKSSCSAPPFPTPVHHRGIFWFPPRQLLEEQARYISQDASRVETEAEKFPLESRLKGQRGPAALQP